MILGVPGAKERDLQRRLRDRAEIDDPMFPKYAWSRTMWGSSTRSDCALSALSAAAPGHEHYIRDIRQLQTISGKTDGGDG